MPKNWDRVFLVVLIIWTYMNHLSKSMLNQLALMGTLSFCDKVQRFYSGYFTR